MTGRTTLSILRRYLAVFIIAALGITLSALAFMWEQRQEQERLTQRFEFLAKERAALMQAAVDRARESLLATGDFFKASRHVSREEFHTFLANRISLHPDIHGIEWLPRVRDSERARFEAKARTEGFTDYRITELGNDGTLIPAKRRLEYFPVYYAEPLEKNRRALGYDSYSRYTSRATMEQARDTGAILASVPFALVQDQHSAMTTILYQAVYNPAMELRTISDRRAALAGYVVALLRIPDLVEQAMSRVATSDLDWQLLDSALPAGKQLLHSHASSSERAAAVLPPAELNGRFSIRVPLDIPGREWQMEFVPTPAFFAQYGTSRQWLILWTSLALTTLLALYLGSRIKRIVETERLARRDYLTGLPNRALLAERLNHALAIAERDNTQVALLFLDLDRFKHVNDSMGHSAGDQLLTQVADRLSRVLRKEDTLARMGGDEFVVVMENLNRGQDAAMLAEKLIETLLQPIAVGDVPLHLTTSIGISLYPRDATTAEALISDADAAMYRAKESGRNTFQFYTPELTKLAHDQVLLVSELKHAQERQELELHYQPQVSLTDGTLFGVEALLRWRHPSSGLVMPDRFIPLAEETGLIIPIGAWVLQEACAQAKRWLDAGLPLQRISVNVAGPQLLRGNLLQTVKQALAATALPAGMLELEVTESFIMGKTESVISVLKDLRRLGITIAVDDFGTGYSSLSRLKRLPIDRLKIDRSFVQDLPFNEDDTAITRAVIALGKSLGLQIIAEGVETAAQEKFLLQEGCHEAQGYHYSRPVPPAAIPELLRENQLRPAAAADCSQ